LQCGFQKIRRRADKSVAAVNIESEAGLERNLPR
jgi:hypothetical protein